MAKPQDELIEGLKFTGVAVVSAVVCAAAVIAAGETFLQSKTPPQPASETLLIPTSG